MQDKTDQIAELLLQTGSAHHTAFLDVDGQDPDWPMWYAEYLQNRLPPLLGRELTMSELTCLMVDLDRRHREKKPDSPWHSFYAQQLIEQSQNLGTAQIVVPWLTTDVPLLTTSQMVEIDRAMVEDYQISLTQMMENAGRCLAQLARTRFLDSDPRGKNIIVLAGTGGNGGGALAAARHLANYGAVVTVVTTRTAESFKAVPKHQLEILQQMEIPIHQEQLLEVRDGDFELIIDGIIGYSLNGQPKGSAARLIHWANDQDIPTLSLDIPSGVDGTTGQAYNPAIRAAATMTLALPKSGLVQQDSTSAVGELYLADISVPPWLYTRPPLNLEVGPIFARSDIVRLS
jgi:NAD(P)H-hydrate epimerase